MMRIVGLAEIQQVIDHDNSFEAVRSSLVQLADGNVNAPDELALIRDKSGEVHVKGAYIKGGRWIVFKVASGGFPGAANSGCSFLLDAESGAPTVILDDHGWLTEMRTAAAGALASDYCAPPGPLRVAVLGTGIQARFQIEALRSRRDVTSLAVWGRNEENLQAIAADTGATACDTVDAATDGADVVITATSATSPILSLSQLPTTVHITAMGSDTVGKHELDPAILRSATLVVADDVETCCRVGELQHAPDLASTAFSMAALAAGQIDSEDRFDGISVADLCGIGTYDAAIAGVAADLLL